MALSVLCDNQLSCRLNASYLSEERGIDLLKMMHVGTILLYKSGMTHVIARVQAGSL